MASTLLCRNQNNAGANASVITEEIFASNSSFEEVPMGVADDGIGFLLDLLTDLSVNRGAYAIREAYSNAYDATLATGDMGRKIEIEIPLFGSDYNGSSESCGSIVDKLNKNIGATATVRFAVICDHGIGMTPDDVKHYFTQYGGSKKRRKKSENIGSKGLGSKAPLACADMFVVETVRDGVKTTAIIERRDGRNFANIKSEPTSEENGTAVKIPIVDAQVSQQMSECIRSISKFNLDANLWINGEKGECFFDGKASDTGYVYLGEVPCGIDEDGKTVSFRMWKRADRLPSAPADSIDLNLAGVRYELYRYSSFYGDCMPDIIVAGEPGYLNFTPSRDQIKDDAARKRFVDAILDALVNFDFSAAIERHISSMTLIDFAHWLHRTWYNAYFDIDFREDGRVYFSASFPRFPNKSEHFDVPASFFVRDGIDCRNLFNKTPYAGNSFVLSSYSPQKKCFCTASVSQDASVYFDGKFSGIFFDKIRKTDLAMKLPRLEAIDFRRLFSYVSEITPKLAFTKMLFITGMPDHVDEFAAWEESIREVYAGANAHVLYAALPANWTGFDAVEQKALAEGGMPAYAVVDIDTAIMEAKKFHKAHYVVSSESEKSPRKTRIVSDLAVSQFISNDDADPVFDRVFYTTHNGYSVDFDNTAYIVDTMFVFGRTTSGAKEAIARLAYALMASGKLPKARRIIWGEDKFQSAEISEIAASGATILLDVRKNIENLAHSALKGIDGVSVRDDYTYKSGVYSPHLTIEASTLYADFDALDRNRKAGLMRTSIDPLRVIEQLELGNMSRLLKPDIIAGTSLDRALKTANMIFDDNVEIPSLLLSSSFLFIVSFSDDTEAGRDVENLKACLRELESLFSIENGARELFTHSFSGLSAEIISDGLTSYVVDNLACATCLTDDGNAAA